MNIAWIGTGVMGSALAKHVMDAGHDMHVHNRSADKAAALVSLGMHAYTSIAECIKDCDAIFTMVGYPKDVEEVYEQIFQSCKPEAICIDMTTSSPTLASKLYKRAKALGLGMLDAPVSGGDTGARMGTLSIMAGGEATIYEQIKPLFETMGTPRYMGEAGMGQHTKACNQIAVAGAVAAMSEALVYARENGLDDVCMLEAISGGAAGSWQINNTAPRVLKADFAPGFYIKHFIKDMHIVQDEMKNSGIHLEVLESVCHMYEQLAQQGEENNGTQALIHYYQK